MINSFNFRVSEKVFISTLLLKGIFTGYRIQDWLFFSFNVLKILLHGLFTYIVSNKKAAVILIFVPLYIACLNFSGCFSDFLFTTGFEQLDYDALVSFFFSFMFLVLVIHWASWICDFIVFIKFWKILVIISLNIFLIFPPFFSITGTPGCLKLSQSPLCCSLFFSHIFLSAFHFG